MEAGALTNFSVWIIAKYLVLFFLGLYIAFSLVVVRQIQVMTNTLDIGFEGFVKAIGYLHLALAVAVFVISFLIL